MKKFIILCLYLIIVSCATIKKVEFPEDTLFQTRKYVGDFIEYRHTSPERFGDPHIIWIKTTMEGVYGKIAAYSRKCDFNPGERLYIRRIYYTPGGDIASGYWIYQIESESAYYRLCTFQYDKKILVQNWW